MKKLYTNLTENSFFLRTFVLKRKLTNQQVYTKQKLILTKMKTNEISTWYFLRVAIVIQFP